MSKIILNSLKESFALIWKNKSLFALLFILQIAFFAVFFYISITYQTKILESAMAIADYLSQQKLDDVSVTSNLLQQKGILGDDPLSISRNFNEMVKNFRLYLAYSFILMIASGSINWAITNGITHKTNFKLLIKNILKIFIILLFYLGLVFSFFFLIINIPLTEVAVESAKLLAKYTPFFIFAIVLIYFMFVSLSVSYGTELKNIVQKTLIIGIKKLHYVLAVFLLNVFLFSVSIFLLYYFIEKNIFVLLLSLTLMVFSFVFGRIFMVSVIEKLANF